MNLPVERLLKSWWAQVEMLNAVGAAWQCTRRSNCPDAFIKLFHRIHHHQIDHECGDWFQGADWETGHPVTTDKGNEFETSFHAGRALIRATKMLWEVLGLG